MTDGNGFVSKVPSVGIFWGLPAEQRKRGRIIVADRTLIGEAEPYGDCLTHERGHYEVWEGWQSLGPAELHRRGLSATISFYDYEHFPRGRVVYN